MVDTVRTLAQLVASAPAGGEFTAQEQRDFMVSVMPPQFSGARVNKGGTNQDVDGSANVQVKVTWSTVVYDTDSYFDDTNDRMIAPTSGFYYVRLSLRTLLTTNDNFRTIKQDGTTDLVVDYTVSDINTIRHVCVIAFLDAGDYVEGYIQANDVAYDVEGTLSYTQFEIARLGQTPA